MDFDGMQDLARVGTSAAKELGFDYLGISACFRRQLGIRVAQSAVCRENVWRSSVSLEVLGSWQGRESQFSTTPTSLEDLLAGLRRLRHDLSLQAPDKEAVLRQPPSGDFSWQPAQGNFEALYAPEALYPLVERCIAPLRAESLRVTGYIEAHETVARTFASGDFKLHTHDHGITMNMSVDDQRTGAVGAAARASIHAPQATFENLLSEVLSEARQTCTTSVAPTEIIPGDYTVVLHPSAVFDLAQTTLAYGLFDRRKIDEGRTYLARKWREINFPAGLSLAQTLRLPLPSGNYCDSPFNARNMLCDSLRLIEDGRIRDLHTSAYWAREHGLRETFQAHGAPPLHLSVASHSPLAGRHKDLAALIADTERGVYVANTWYLRMVAEMEGVITGMTRDGLYEIKDGKLVRPLVNMRWHENPIRILSAITGLSENKSLLGMSRLAGHARSGLGLMPALRVEGFHFSSATKF